MRNKTLERMFAYFKKVARQAREWLLAPDAPSAPETVLEKRVLLNANPVINDQGMGVFDITTDCPDDMVADNFTLERVTIGMDDWLRITVNGNSADIALAADIKQITIDGSGDNDTFTIDHDAIVENGVFINGMGGTDQVTIQESGTPDFDSVDYAVGDTTTIVTINQANPDPDLVVNITGVEQITDTLNADSKSIAITENVAEMSVATTATTVNASLGADLTMQTDLLIVSDLPSDSLAFDVSNSATQLLTLTSIDESGIDLTLSGDSNDTLEVGTGGVVVAEDIVFDGGNLSVVDDVTGASSITVQNTTTFEIDGTSDAIEFETTAGDITFNSSVFLTGGNTITIDSNGGEVDLASVSGTDDNLVANLTVTSDESISFTNIDLADATAMLDGSLSLTVNTDSVGTETLSIGPGPGQTLSNIGTLTLSGTVAGDSINIDSAITTTVGGILIQNAQVDIGGNLTSAGAISVQSGSTIVLDATSAIQLQSNGGSIAFNNDISIVGGNTATLDANGGGVSLVNVSGADDNLVANLTVTSDESISFTNIDLADATASSAGTLSLTVNADFVGTETLTIGPGQTLGDIGTLTLSGTVAGDSIDIDSAITTSTGGILIQNAQVDIGADLTSAGAISVQSGSTIVLDASNAIQLQSNSGAIDFNNAVSLAGGNTATLDANGGGVTLTNVTGADDNLLANLTITSDEGIGFTSIDLEDATNGSAGALSLTINQDGMGTLQQMDIDTRFGMIGSLTVSGGTAGDLIRVTDAFSTVAGGIVLQNADIDILANLTAATSIDVSGSTQFVIDGTSAPIQIQSNNGAITFGSDVALAGGNTVTLNSIGGGVDLAGVTGVDDNLVANLTVTSADSISFDNIELADATAGSAGALSLTVNTASVGTETLTIGPGQTIGDVGTLTLSGTVAGDSINIDSAITTSTGGILIQNAQVDIGADLTSAGAITVQSGSTIVLDASNAIQLQSNSGAISFNNDLSLVGGNTATLNAIGGGVTLTNVTGADDNLLANLTIFSDEGIGFTSIDLEDATNGSAGALSLTINQDGMGTLQQMDIDTRFGMIGSLTVSGALPVTSSASPMLSRRLSVRLFCKMLTSIFLPT